MTLIIATPAQDHILINAQGSAYSANHVFIYQQQNWFEEKKIICGRNSLKILFEIELYKEWDEYRSHVAKTGPKYDVSEWFCLGSCAGVKRVVGGARCQNIPKT